MSTALLCGAAYLGIKASEKAGKNWVGWLVGFGALIMLFLLFYPSIDSLKKRACRDAVDFEECMDPPEPDY